MVQTGALASDAWAKQYPQLSSLFEVDGFGELMLVIISNLLRDNKFGLIFRVCVGAILSVSDAATDIYVISTYYESSELTVQGNTLLAMITTNMVCQLICMLAQNAKKNSWVKLREALICLSFLRPAVDAYRVSMNSEDDETTYNALTEMIINKVLELFCKSIPGSVLQMYVWLINPDEASTFALASILGE